MRSDEEGLAQGNKENAAPNYNADSPISSTKSVLPLCTTTEYEKQKECALCVEAGVPVRWARDGAVADTNDVTRGNDVARCGGGDERRRRPAPDDWGRRERAPPPRMEHMPRWRAHRQPQ